jgi:RND superfamily putative drug exporter
MESQTRPQGRTHRWFGWVAGRRARYVSLLVWVVLAAALSLALPSATGQEAQSPQDLASTAQSVVAAKLQTQAFGLKNETPGVLVFYRKGGLTAQNLRSISGYLTRLAGHPVQGEIGKPPLAGLGAAALKGAVAHGSTLAVPLFFRSTGDATKLAQRGASLERSLRQGFAADLLTRPASSGRLVARLTGAEGIAGDAAGLFKNADVTLLAATTVLILVLLVLIYRSPILPFIPLVGVGFAYMVTQAVLGALAKAHWIVIDAETVSIMTVLMFGAGTDYALLVVARYRERLAEEQDHLRALREAMGGAAGAVAMSAGTVMAALLVLLLSRYGPEHRFAIPFALGVGLTAVASLTLVPALLAVLGRTAFYPFVPRPGKSAARREGAVAGAVARRPWLVASLATLLLLGLAAFSPGVRTSYDLLSALPATSQARQGAGLLGSAYGSGSLSPVTLLVAGPGANQSLDAALAQTPGVRSVAPPTYGRAQGRRVAAYQVTLRANPFSNAAMAVLPRLEASARSALGNSPGSRVYVSGPTAQNRDAAAAVARDTWVVIPIVLALIALLLLAYLRSVVAALYLIATVLLSFFAAVGLGWIVLHDVLGIQGLAGGVVLYAFVFLVALGEDYNIFMVSRIWQERRLTAMPQAVRRGMTATGGVITAAGLILAGTFLVLTALPLQILLEFGVMAALGVLLDTFIVRSALVPALTAILGDRAFWPSRPFRPSGGSGGTAV